MKRAIKILNLVLAVILVGIMVVIWFAFDSAGLSAAAYIERQHQMIRMLNTPMPILGAVTILLTFVSSYLRRSAPATAVCLVAAALLLIGSGVITRFCNQPINAIVMTWNANAFPSNWESLRDTWWRWHIGRTVLAIVGLGLLFFGYRIEIGPSATHEKTGLTRR